MRLTTVWLVVLFFSATTSCSGSNSVADASMEEYLDGADGGADSAADWSGCGDHCAKVDAESLPGSYAMFQVNSRIVNVPVVGQSRSETRTKALVTVTRRDQEHLDMLIRVCDLEQVSETTLVEVVFPEAFLKSLEAYPRLIELRPDLGINNFTSPLAVEVYGARLENPQTDPLPTEASDSRVYDQDGDGKPGITIRVTGIVDGEIWLVQRNSSTLSGLFESADRWSGLIDSEVEQVYLGSDNPALSKPNESWKDPDPSHSYFIMVRVGEDKDCSWIVDNWGTLFP